LLFVAIGLIVLAYVVMVSRTVFVLSYHSIGPEKTPIPGLSIPTEAFRRHVRLLALLGLKAEPIDLLAANVRGKDKRCPHLCITFDDGYRTVLQNALPILQEMRWPATVFVPTGHVGHSNVWDQANGVPELSVMDWTELQDLSKKGIQIGSHGRAHVSLLNLPDERCWEELHGSRADLQSHLGQFSQIFCYPFGHRHPGLGKLAQKAGYEGACSVVRDAFPDNPYDIGRIVVRYNSTPGFAFQLFTYPIVSAARKIMKKLKA